MTTPLKTGLLVFALTVATLAPPRGFSQATAAAAPTAAPSKIAFVNLQEAVVSCNEGSRSPQRYNRDSARNRRR
jgi:hypothetical protein